MANRTELSSVLTANTHTHQQRSFKKSLNFFALQNVNISSAIHVIVFTRISRFLQALNDNIKQKYFQTPFFSRCPLIIPANHVNTLHPPFPLLEEVLKGERGFFMHLSVYEVESVALIQGHNSKEAVFSLRTVRAPVKRYFSLGPGLTEIIWLSKFYEMLKERLTLQIT